MDLLDERPVAHHLCPCPACACPVRLSTAGTEVVVYCPACGGEIRPADLEN
jgi:hypothetical protein